LAPYHEDYCTVLATKTIKGIFCLRDVQPSIGIETQLIEFGTNPDFMVPEMSSVSLIHFLQFMLVSRQVNVPAVSSLLENWANASL
jgi:hypothetical protein